MILVFIVRVLGVRHGLPGIYHPDEPIVVSRAVNVVINGDLNPHFFHWPSLLMYLLAIEYEIIYLIGKLAGSFNNTDDFFRYYSLFKGDFHLWGRVLIALMGTGFSYFLFLITKLWFDRKMAYCALFVSAFTPLLIKHSHFITPDIPALFFASVSIYFLSKYHFLEKRVAFLYWASVMAGLAAATKYNYALMIIPVMIILLSDTPQKFQKKLNLSACVIGSMIVTFFIFNPFILIDFKTFAQQFKEITLHLSEGHIGMEAKSHPSIDLLKHTFSGTSIIIFAGALIGAIISLFKDRIWALALISFPLLILLSHGRWPVTADRYAIPLLIFVLYFFPVTIQVIYQRFSSHPSVYKFALLALLILSLPISASAKTISNHMKMDTREVAREWINRNIPAHSKLALEKGGPYVRLQHANSEYHNDPAYLFLIITPWYGSSFRTENSPMELLMKNKPEYVVINSGVYSRYQPGSPSETTFPQVYKIWRNYYDSLETIGDLLYEVNPSKKFIGPTVKIYHIPDDAYDYVIAIPPTD